MALKILKESPKKLPKGADRFLWNEVPVVKSETPQDFARILKGLKKNA